MMPTAYRSFPTVTDCPFDGFVRVPVSLGDSTKPLRPLSIHGSSLKVRNNGRLTTSGKRSPLPLLCQAGGTTAPFGRFVAGRGYQNRKATKMITAAIQLIDWVPDFEGWPLQKSAPVLWLERFRNFQLQFLTKKRGMGEENSKALFCLHRTCPTALLLIRKSACNFISRFTPALRVSVRALARGN